LQVGSLKRPQHRFKVDVNAQENHLTGAAVIADDFCVVVVEGGATAYRQTDRQTVAHEHGRSAMRTDGQLVGRKAKLWAVVSASRTDEWHLHT
jgi:Protein of unknown function (DUF1115)